METFFETTVFQKGGVRAKSLILLWNKNLDATLKGGTGPCILGQNLHQQEDNEQNWHHDSNTALLTEKNMNA